MTKKTAIISAIVGILIIWVILVLTANPYQFNLPTRKLNNNLGSKAAIALYYPNAYMPEASEKIITTNTEGMAAVMVASTGNKIIDWNKIGTPSSLLADNYKDIQENVIRIHKKYLTLIPITAGQYNALHQLRRISIIVSGEGEMSIYGACGDGCIIRGATDRNGDLVGIDIYGKHAVPADAIDIKNLR